MSLGAAMRSFSRGEIGILGTASLGESGALLTPFIVGAIIYRYGLDDAYAGGLITLQLTAMALGSLLLSARIDKISPRTTALVAASADIIGYLIPCFFASIELLIVSRIITGAAEGVLWSVANTTAAKSPNTIGVFSRIMIVVGVFAIVLPLGIAELGASLPGSAAFLALALFCLALLPCLFFLPHRLPAGESQALPVRGKLPLRSLLALLALSTFIMGQISLWIYVERIGAIAGLRLEEVALAISFSYVIGLLGALASALLSGKLKRPPIFSLGLASASAVALLTAYAASALPFYLGVIGINVVYMFVMPYYKEFIAWIDSSGRTAAAAAAFFSLGTILGPMAASLIVGLGYAYSVLGWLATGFFGVSLLMIMSAHSRAAAASPTGHDLTS